MSVRTILSIGHPVLREVALEVPVDDIGSETIQTLIDDLVDTMRHAAGAGSRPRRWANASASP